MVVVIYLFVCLFFKMRAELSLDDAVTFILLSEPSNDAGAFKVQHLEG